MSSSPERHRALDPDCVIETARRLSSRVVERFPDSGLSRVAEEISAVSKDAAARATWLSKPIVALRIAIVVCALVIFAILGGMLTRLKVTTDGINISDFFQGIEAAVNDLILFGAGLYFLASWETRIKRRRALRALHELRSLAHVIDMHQLTKDPEKLAAGLPDTPSSPPRTMSPAQLTRYLDYCSELLALLSKIAAIYVERFDDSVTIEATNDLEALTSGLSRKIWQKIMILDRMISS